MNSIPPILTRPGFSARALMIFMALGFLAMFFVALTGNFKNSRTVQKVPEQATVNMPVGMEGNIGMLMQRVAKEPDNMNLLMELTEMLVAAGNWEAAETFAKRGITLDMQDQRPLYLMGVILHNKGQHKEAAEIFEKALAIKPAAPFHYSLGVLYTYFLNDPQRGLGNFNSALNAPDSTEDLKQSIRQELDKQSTRNNQPQKDKKTSGLQEPTGNTPPLSREMAQQIAEMEKVVLRNPNDAAAWANLGNLYFDTGKAPNAISAYERSLQLAPGDPNVLTDLGIMYRDIKNFTKAIDCFRKAISLNPRHENAFFNMGVVFYYDLRQKEDAEQAWQQLLKVNPGARAPDGQPVAELVKHLH